MLHANELEVRAAKALMEALKDRKSMARALEVTHRSMQAEASTLVKQASPLKAALKDMQRELEEIELSRIRAILPKARLDAIEKDALRRRAELKTRLEALGGDTLRDLEWQRDVLENGRPLFDWASTYGKDLPVRNVPNFHSFRPMGDPPVSDEVARGIAVAPVPWLMDRKLAEGPAPSLRDIVGHAFDRLHAELFVHRDRVEIRGLVPFEVPDQSTRASHPPEGSG